MGSWFDLVLVGLLVGSIAFGLHQGLLRQGFLLLAMYVGTVLSAQYYGHVAGLFLRAFPFASPDAMGVLAFLILVGLFTTIVTWLTWSGYKDTKFARASIVDHVGGATFGVVSGLFAIALTLMMVNYSLNAPWTDGSEFRYALRAGMSGSALQDLLSIPVPVFQSAIRPWVPDVPLWL